MLLGAIAAVSLVQPLGWQSTVLIVCAVGATLLFVTAVSEGAVRLTVSRPIPWWTASRRLRSLAQRVVQILENAV